MARMLGKMLLVLLLVMPTAIMLAGNDRSTFVGAQDGNDGVEIEDTVEGEDDEGDATITDEDSEAVKTEGAVSESDIEKAGPEMPRFRPPKRRRARRKGGARAEERRQARFFHKVKMRKPKKGGPKGFRHQVPRKFAKFSKHRVRRRLARRRRKGGRKRPQQRGFAFKKAVRQPPRKEAKERVRTGKRRRARAKGKRGKQSGFGFKKRIKVPKKGSKQEKGKSKKKPRDSATRGKASGGFKYSIPKKVLSGEDDEDTLKPSPDADTHILFVKPEGQEFPAGDMVRFLVGFTNKGKKDFTVESMDASFRYPQDFSFYIQNFTVAKYDRTVEPSRQATFEYMFTPSETFNARPFGLTINLNYKDTEGKQFVDAVFNDTVNIVEADEGLDGETFFLYVFLAAVAVLLLVGAQQLLASFGKKRMTKPKAVVEMGTQNKGDVDFDWIPKEALVNHSPGRSPKQKTSPRQRRSKRNTGGDD